MAAPVALIRPFGAALAVFRPARGVGFGAHQGVEDRSRQCRPVDMVGSGHRVDSFARVTLVGLSKNHAMTLIYPATTRRPSTHGPTHTPPWWTQPAGGNQLRIIEC